MRDCVAVLDVGTSGLKTALFDVGGRTVAQARAEYPVHTPAPGWAEQDPEDWWNAAAASLRSVLARAGSVRVEAVTITNQQVTTVPVDVAGRPLDRAILWMDTRTAPLVTDLRQSLGDAAVLHEVGMPISTSWAALRPLWWKQRRPEVYASAHKFLLVDAYLYGKLTGRWVSDESNACFSAFDTQNRKWSEALIAELGLDRSHFPEVVPPGARIGVVTPEAAAATGLPPGTPVLAGASDQPCSAIGLGAVAEGQFEATTGTGTFMIAHVQHPMFDRRLMTNCAGIPGRWLMYGVHYLSGAVLRWFRDEFYAARGRGANQDPYDDITAAAATVPAGAEGLTLLPYFQGARTPHFDDKARGVLYGLTLRHTWAHVARAILESNAFGIRQTIEVMAELGISLQEIRAAGGGSRSDLWCQIQADAADLDVMTTRDAESTALGAALIAWTAAGAYPSVEAAAQACVAVERRYRPDPRLRAAYDQAYTQYADLYHALRGQFHAPVR